MKYSSMTPAQKKHKAEYAAERARRIALGTWVFPPPPPPRTPERIRQQAEEQKERVRNWQKANRDKLQGYRKKGYESLKEKRKADSSARQAEREAKRKARVLLTAEERTEKARKRQAEFYKRRAERKQGMKALLLEAQAYLCGICKRDLRELPTIFVHLDHNHACCPAGKVCKKCARGVLCAKCNHLLGFAEDKLETLQGALEYLAKLSYPLAA